MSARGGASMSARDATRVARSRRAIAKTNPAASPVSAPRAMSRRVFGAIGFLDIERVVDYTLNQHTPKALDTLEEIMNEDRLARESAYNMIERVSQERRNRY